MTNERRGLDLMLPIRLPAGHGVKATLMSAPEEQLRAELSELGFWQMNYADIRIGKIGNLDAAIAAVDASPGGSVWKTETVGDYNTSKTEDIVGDLVGHIRAYEPGAAGARVRAIVSVRNGTEVVKFRGEWVAWTKVWVEPTF